MTWDRLIEIAILITLWVEFWYDAWWNNAEQRRKRRSKGQRSTHSSLTTGEMK